MAKPTVALSKLKFYAATPSRWADIETLFGERGACGGCWCMAWRLRNKDWLAGKGSSNKRAFKKIVTSGEVPGVLAYLGREPIGWCAVAPRTVYSALERSRVLKPVDDQPVWSITCLFILRPYRRRGVSARLIKAAVEIAGKRGASIVEAYPTEPYTDNAPAPFLWTGIPSAFRAAGFKEVMRRSRTRPIMRKRIRKA